MRCRLAKIETNQKQKQKAQNNTYVVRTDQNPNKNKKNLEEPRSTTRHTDTQNKKLFLRFFALSKRRLLSEIRHSLRLFGLDCQFVATNSFSSFPTICEHKRPPQALSDEVKPKSKLTLITTLRTCHQLHCARCGSRITHSRTF